MSNNSNFKIFFSKEDKTILTKGSFSKFSDFKSLRKEIINTSQKPTFKGGKLRLSEGENFVLEVFEAEGPIKEKVNELPPIFNNKTFTYFVEKVNSCSENEISKVKFCVKKVKKLPTWNPPQYDVTLKKALIDSYDDVKNSITKDLSEHRLNVAKEEFDKKKLESDPELKDFFYNRININLICQNCFMSNFYGERYVCAECKNYNLCEDCYLHIRNNQLHNKDHTFINIKKPINEENNKFSNIISPKYFYFDDKQTSFGIKFTLVNIGEMNLASSFIVPIRYGNKYLSCLRKTITESMDKNEKNEVEIMIKFPEDDQEGTYEGYFRMFTESGIPFGDILYVKAVRNSE